MHVSSTNTEIIITSDITTEWKMYHQLLVSKPKNDMKTQVKDPLSHFLDEGLYAYNYL